MIDEVAEAARCVTTSETRSASCGPDVRSVPNEPQFHSPDSVQGRRDDRLLSAEQIIRQRRSAVDMDAQTVLDRDVFYGILARLMPGSAAVLSDSPRPPRCLPFYALSWQPRVSLALFVHRVRQLPPGLYLLARDPSHEAALRPRMKLDFSWQRPEGCPADVNLWLLQEADCRRAARAISCHQDIAADGVFSLGMLAEFEPALRELGPWFYPRLFWETGLIGQVLYLEAEAAGIRGTGIGCFFDDAMHDVLGIRDRSWQSLYHFTVGGPIEDPRLQTIPPYTHLATRDNKVAAAISGA